MNFVYKKDRAGLEVRKNRRKISRSLDRDSGRVFKVRSKSFCNQMRERCFTHARRSVKKKVFGHCPTFFGGLDNNTHVLFYVFLNHVLVPRVWAKRAIKGLIGLKHFFYFFWGA